MVVCDIAVARHGLTYARILSWMMSHLDSGGNSHDPMGQSLAYVDGCHRDACAGRPWAPDGSSTRIPLVLHLCSGLPHQVEWSEDPYPQYVRCHIRSGSDLQLSRELRGLHKWESGRGPEVSMRSSLRSPRANLLQTVKASAEAEE